MVYIALYISTKYLAMFNTKKQCQESGLVQLIPYLNLCTFILIVYRLLVSSCLK